MLRNVKSPAYQVIFLFRTVFLKQVELISSPDSDWMTFQKVSEACIAFRTVYLV